MIIQIFSSSLETLLVLELLISQLAFSFILLSQVKFSKQDNLCSKGL